MNLRFRNALQVIGCVLLCQTAGLIGVGGMRSEVTWACYNSLSKPPINPPGWVLGPVWTKILYA